MNNPGLHPFDPICRQLSAQVQGDHTCLGHLRRNPLSEKDKKEHIATLQTNNPEVEILYD